MRPMETLNLSEHPEAKEEQFGEFLVRSHSGLSTTEKILIEASGDLRPSSKRILICENRSGVIGQILSKREASLHVSQLSSDHFYHRRLKERWEGLGVEFLLGASLPEGEAYDEILIQMSQSMSAEFLADILQQAYRSLLDGGRVWVALESRHGSSVKDMKKRYGALTEDSLFGGKLIRLKKKGPLKKIKSHLATVECPLAEKEALIIQTRPGVFSHRRIDGGAMALIKRVQLKGEERVLELGCGCGVVSLALKRTFPRIEMHALDSNAVSVAQTEINAKLNHLELNGLQLNSSGWVGEESFDVVVGNPPYFGDHKLSAFFIDEAKKVLNKGGVFWLVAKKMGWNLEYASQFFDLAETYKHGDYQVVKLVLST
jgi:16S rRNA G1207 methylase RsmC